MAQRIAFGQPKQLLEADVTKQVKGFLEAHGWRCIRMQRMVLPGSFQTGEPGMADSCWIRYEPRPKFPALSLVLWIEYKAESDRRKCRCLQNLGTRKRCSVCDQKNWQKRERERGAMVWIVTDLDWFVSLYRKNFGWLHAGDGARGQLNLLSGMEAAK